MCKLTLVSSNKDVDGKKQLLKNSRKNMIVSPKLSPGTSDTKFEDTSLSRVFFIPMRS